MRAEIDRNRRSFWLTASNFYVLSVALSVAFLFVVWGILNDGGYETPWIPAGISASVLLCGAVILREVILRRAHNRFLRHQRIMKNRVYAAANRSQINATRNANKLTLEKNAAILQQIRQKSEAAKLLNKFSAGHREVFEICGEYLALNEGELKTVNANSPRLVPLLKSRSSVAEYHHYHVLRWAEIESRRLTNEAQNRQRFTERIEAAQKALSVLESALGSYPSDESLLQSRELLRDLVVSIKVSDWVERAERAAFKGNYAKAKSLYGDALFYLSRDNSRSPAREQAAARINAEIEHIRMLESGEDT
jgi:hypothetical protein